MKKVIIAYGSDTEVHHLTFWCEGPLGTTAAPPSPIAASDFSSGIGLDQMVYNLCDALAGPVNNAFRFTEIKIQDYTGTTLNSEHFVDFTPIQGRTTGSSGLGGTYACFVGRSTSGRKWRSFLFGVGGAIAGLNRRTTITPSSFGRNAITEWQRMGLVASPSRDSLTTGQPLISIFKPYFIHGVNDYNTTHFSI